VTSLYFFPIILLLRGFYNLLNSIKNLELFDIFLSRIVGLILPIIILTKLYDSILYYIFFNNFIFVIIFLYIILVIFCFFFLNSKDEGRYLIYKRLEVILELRNYNEENFTIINRIILTILEIFNINEIEYQIKDSILAVELYRIIDNFIFKKGLNEKYLFILNNLEKNVFLNLKIIRHFCEGYKYLIYEYTFYQSTLFDYEFVFNYQFSDMSPYFLRFFLINLNKKK
jgi:hypothetical protein